MNDSKIDFVVEDFIMKSFGMDDEDEIETSDISMWIREKDTFRTSGDVSTQKQLDPGMYTVHVNRDYGIFCRKIDIKSDELFVFNNSQVKPLIKEIDLFWNKAEVYKKNRLIHKRGILLEGLPGTGKSSIISLLASDLIKAGGVVFKVNGAKNLGDYIEFVCYSLRKIQPKVPIITIIEDMDQYDDVEDLLLDFLDGKYNLDHHVVIGTTNNTQALPPTYLRPSRIDLRVVVGRPNEQTRREFLKHKNVPEDVIETLISKTGKFTLADLKELYICIYVLDYSIEDALKKLTVKKEKKNYLDESPDSSEIGI